MKISEIKRIIEAYNSTLPVLSFDEVCAMLGYDVPTDEDMAQYDPNAIYGTINEHLHLYEVKNKALNEWRLNRIKYIQEEDIALPLAYPPLAIELSAGCSQHCSFCGVAAEPLKKVALATADNIKDFNAILDFFIDLMGDIAADPMLYYSTEPLDNPNYWTYADIVRERSGYYPQLSTTQYRRCAKQLHAWIKNVNKDQNMYHRFSVRTLEDLFYLYDAYSPDELLYINLSARYDENTLKNCGRCDKEDAPVQPVACVSGFIVNMANRTIRLETPCIPDRQHPNGINLLYASSWTDINELKYKVLSMIDHL